MTALEMEMDSLSVEGNTTLDTSLQRSSNEDTVGDSRANFHQLANKDIPLQDIIGKEPVKHSYTKPLYRTAILICVILIVIGVMQVPVTLYATAPSSDGMTDILFNLVEFESCSINVEVCKIMSYDMVVGVCQSQMNYSTEALSSCNDVQAVTALALVYGLGTMLDSRSCVEDGISFFCNSIAVLCGNVNGSSLLTEECVEIRDSNCAVEWRIVGNLLPNVSVPDCSSLDDEANLTFSAVTPPQTCPNDFDVFCNTFCLPVCGETSPQMYSDSIINFYHVWAILMVVISLTGGIVVFIAVYLKRETIFKYPVVFIVYGAILIPFLDVFVILPYIIGPTLFCSTDNLLVAMQEPTIFCEIQGLVLHGAISTFSLLLFFHILHLFGGVAFPFKSKQLWQSKSFKRKAYVVEIIVILICGLLPSVIILSVSEYRFRGFPLVCLPSSEPVPVYIFLVSNGVAGASSLFLLFVTFWIIHKNAKQDTRKKVNHFTCKRSVLRIFSIKSLLSSFSVAEIKLLILLCYYLVTIMILLTNISLSIAGSERVMKSISSLISCTAGGTKAECKATREALQEDIDDDLVLICLAHALRALIQWVSLVFVIQSSDIKAVYKKIVDFSFRTQ